MIALRGAMFLFILEKYEFLSGNPRMGCVPSG
jgi:hypothetical protein